jgi:(2Fe-2S) ferredoxin
MSDGRRRAGDPPPYYEAHVFVCCNRRPEGHRRGSCAEKGSEALRDYMKARVKELGLKGVRVNMAGCLDRCEFGPTMVIYPEGVWYRVRTREDVDAVLEAHLVRGERVPELMLTERDVVEKTPKPAAASAAGGDG